MLGRAEPVRRDCGRQVEERTQAERLVTLNPPEPFFAHPFPFRAFVSHSSRDSELVIALHERLHAVGIELYLAEHDVRPGSALSAKVQSAIERSHTVIVLLTENAANSAYVQQEIGYALRCGRPVIPLVEARVSKDSLAMLEGCEYIPLDPSDPAKAFKDAEAYLERLKSQKEWKDLAVALMVIGGVIFLMSGGQSGGSSLA